MRRAERDALLERARRHLADGTTDLAPSVMRQPVSAYTDAGHAATERDAVRRLPLIVAHASEVPMPGDFVTVDVAGVPLVVIRQDGGSIRAFANVCRHRGARVVTDECGSARVLSCPFHAWSYDRDGTLRSVSNADGFAEVDRSTLGLVALPAAERHGFVWVVPSTAAPADAVDPAAHLGPQLDDDLAAFGLADHVVERSRRFDTEVNWKLVVDGFLEDYHLRFLHAKTIGPYFAPDLHVFDAFGPHGRFVPLRRSFLDAAATDGADLDVLAHAIVLYVIFPSTVLLWQADHFELWTVFPHPTDVRRSTTTVRLLTRREEVTSERPRWDKNWEILMSTVPVEDWVAAASIQDGLAAGTQHELLFGRNEPALQHFHRSLAEAVR